MSVRAPAQVRAMFGRIVPRYDLVNRLMSFGMDGSWRRRAAALAEPQGRLVLDLGAGTGDLALELARQGARCVVGVDFSLPMLSAARRKASGAGGLRVTWLAADVLHLPFRDCTFASVTSAFLLRNLADLAGGLREMARVVKSGGEVVCLDMTQPPPGALGWFQRLYVHRLLPPLARLVSGERDAYLYLPASLEGFPDAKALAALLAQVGLREVGFRRLGAGAVALHWGRKSQGA